VRPAAAVAARADAVRERITAAGGDPSRIRLVAVTKGFGVEVVQAALEAGLVDLGENYAQELLAKVEALQGAEARWHFVGRLQRNKVRKVASHVALWQSVDRLSLGTEIARWSPGAPVLVQVDLTGEPAKGGCPPPELPALLDGLGELGLEVRGLMGLGPLGDPEEARPGFRELSHLADKYGLLERSMGMSADLEVGVQEGATMIRVGSDLFGPRPGSVGARH
jgi:PLP dependent protein